MLLGMTVRTDQLKIRQIVVISVSILMVNLQNLDFRITTPFTLCTTLIE
jgi:hypothetical protein